ncbi:MAG TPA: hypothetical protein VGB24_19815 [Longimicrobium sp.]|jgi:hypothetical protein|uniref:hypothetical protein n=1 Tax=Longimicrobium sp. TaxID=2029185 RepID=UPI002ED7C84F
MKKLKLEMESLNVQSFAVAAEDAEQGTVMAHSGFTNCGGITCIMSLCPDCGGTVGGGD